MVRFYAATFSLFAVALSVLISIRTMQEANADVCGSCTDAGVESFCATYGAGPLFCDNSITDQLDSNKFFTKSTSFQHCETDIPELGWFEVVAGSMTNIQDVSYSPVYFFPQDDPATHCGRIAVTISGHCILNDSGSLTSKGVVWSPTHYDTQVFTMTPF